MRKFIIITCSILVILFIFLFVLKNVVMWQGIYSDNIAMNSETNEKIKSLVISAVKDRCSKFYSIQQDKIYDEASLLDNIQYDESAAAEKSWMCIINRDFMESAHTISENKYSLIVKISYPEDYYYNFIVEDTGEGYMIMTFQLDT